MDDIMANPDAIGATFLRMADIPSSISLRHEEERLGLLGRCIGCCGLITVDEADTSASALGMAILWEDSFGPSKALNGLWCGAATIPWSALRTACSMGTSGTAAIGAGSLM